MAKFQIPKIPVTTNKSIRFPDDLIEDIEVLIRGQDCNFSAFVVAAVRSVVDELKEEAEEKKDKEDNT